MGALEKDTLLLILDMNSLTRVTGMGVTLSRLLSHISYHTREGVHPESDSSHAANAISRQVKEHVLGMK